MIRSKQAALRRSQGGNILILVVILLLLGSVFTLFALNVGRFEQKTSGNDLRAKLVQEVADAGIAQGVEFFNANRAIITAEDNWRLCSATETRFPCGAVPQSRRSTMWAYVTAKPDGSLADRQIATLPVPLTQAGGFDVTRQVGAVLCRVEAISPTGGGADCATDISNASTTWVITVVSKATLSGEGSSATATQTIGAYNIFGVNSGIPPVVASGSVAVGGGFQVVAAATDEMGNNPVSIWTRLDVDANGTPNTCFWEDFVRDGGSSSPPQYYDGIEVCHTCKCPTDGSISYGKGASFCEGDDIYDIEADIVDYTAYATGADANPGVCPVCSASNPEACPNLSIRREEFPRDLFAFLFGQSAWQDVNRDGVAVDSPCTFAALDCNFAETRIVSTCAYRDPATGAQQTAMLPADTCYLLNIKNKTHIGDGINDATECAALGTGSKGIVWVHSAPILDASGNPLPAAMPGYDCETTLRGVDQLGTPSDPVALLYDGVLTQVHFQLYGLYFGREPNASTTLSDTLGGSAELGMNAGATIYGAAVIQGRVSSGGGGTAAIVYNKDVLFNLINDPANMNPLSIPGSWTDRMRY